MIGPDPALLRRAVRLVHCLQRERGTSCAFSVSPESFGDQLHNARRQTDHSFSKWKDLDVASLNQSITKIRAQLDLESQETKKGVQPDMTHFHRILVLFNTLIGTVVSNWILAHVHESTGQYGRRVKAVDTLKRSTSEEDFIDKTSQTSSSMSRIHSSNELHSMNNNNKQGSRVVGFAKSILVGSTKLLVDSSKVPALMNLIDIFVRLKESTGYERALLSSMFAFRKVDRRLLNDLVLEVENQYKLIKELQEVKSVNQSLIQLVRQGVLPSKQMERLQKYILREFDLKGFQQDLRMGDVWNFITVYMDRLHSLELLLVEELEYALLDDQPLAESKDTDGKIIAQASAGEQKKEKEKEETNGNILNSIFDANGELPLKLKEMPAEQVKEMLLNYVTNGSSSFLDASTSSLSSGPLGSVQEESTSVPREWEIDLYEIQFLRHIGRGTAGTTYLGKWRGQQVAVKVATISEMGLEGWKTEISSLRKLHHSNIIRLLGSVYHESPLTYCLVLEYCSSGDLEDAMQKQTPPNFFVKTASDIANGLAYLHSRNVIHRDIKPSNVLLDGDVASGKFTAKVSDFGVAVVEKNDNMTSETGTYRWMAPEVIRHDPYDTKADVFSFAVVMWQLLTREEPFADCSAIEAAGKVALEHARPPIPTGTPRVIRELIEGGWRDDPKERLSLKQLCEKLPDVESLSGEEAKWLKAPLGHPVYCPHEPTETVKEPPQTAEVERKDKGAKNPKDKVAKNPGRRGIFTRKSSRSSPRK